MELNAGGIMVDGHFFRVMDYPEEKIKKKGPLNVLEPAVAYRFTTGLTQGIFPYRGIWKDTVEWNEYNTEVGIYIIKRTGKIRIRRPRNKEEKKKFSLDAEINIAAGIMNHQFNPEDFTNVSGSIGMDGKAFKPPLRPGDDALNTLVKTVIRLKNAPFEPYGKLLENYTSGSNPSEGMNRRNNSKRGIWSNSAMSSNKADMYLDIWGADYAILVKDVDNTIYPMFEDGTILTYFPNGRKFTIDPDKLVDADLYIKEGLDESAEFAVDNEYKEED